MVEKTITETQEFSGRLEAIEQVQIRPRVAGFITAINFKPGSQVKKGDVLFVIDPRPFQAEANRAEAAAGSARAKADLAKVELARAEKLLADKAIAQREYDASSSSLKQLDADARAAQAQFEAARLNLSYTQVTSPINGRVSKAEITLGNLVDASAVLTSVVSLDQIYASFDGDEETYLRVGAAAHQGKPATVKIGLANETASRTKASSSSSTTSSTRAAARCACAPPSPTPTASWCPACSPACSWPAPPAPSRRC